MQRKCEIRKARQRVQADFVEVTGIKAKGKNLPDEQVYPIHDEEKANHEKAPGKRSNQKVESIGWITNEDEEHEDSGSIKTA